MSKQKWPESTYLGKLKADGAYKVEAGRLITRQGEPFISIHRHRDIEATEADELTHVIALLLNKLNNEGTEMKRKHSKKEAESTWQSMHRAAMELPLPGFEKALVKILDGLKEYIKAHHEEFDSP